MELSYGVEPYRAKPLRRWGLPLPQKDQSALTASTITQKIQFGTQALHLIDQIKQDLYKRQV